MEFVYKNISIKKYQADYIEKACINLSRLVQKELDKKIKKIENKTKK